MTPASVALFLLLLIPLIKHSLAGALVLQAPLEDRGDKLKFGQATCLSRDGRRVFIGANGFDKFRGAVYVYDLASGSGSKLEHWRRTRLCANNTQPAHEKKPRELRAVSRGSGFGFSCAVSKEADSVVVGAPGHDVQKGAVYVFRYEEEGRVWMEGPKLDNPHRRSGDAFGWAVGVNSDCTTVVASAKGRRANNGEVYSYSCEAGCTDCQLGERIVPPDITDSTGPRGIRIRNNFGVSLAINGNGDVMAVGSTGYDEERGAVYVYARDGESGNWTFSQRLESPNAQKFGFFGFKLAIDYEGEKIVVGADGEADYKGAAYVFHRQVDKDGNATFEHFQELLSGKRVAEDNFGGSVALSGDGRALLVGAPGANRGHGKDHGVMYMYEQVKGKQKSKWELAESIWLPHEHSQAGNFFAWTVGVSGNGKRFVSTAPDSYSGAGLATVGELRITGKRALDSNSLVHDDVVTEDKQEL